MNRLTEVQLVHLHVSTLIGSLGATHWYAELQTEDDNGELEIIELSHPLSTAETDDLNKSEEYTMMWDFRVGEAYKGFWSHEKAIEAGRQQWKEQCPEGRVYSVPSLFVPTFLGVGLRAGYIFLRLLFLPLEATFSHPHKGQIAVKFIYVQTVPENELVFDVETHIIKRYFYYAPGRFIQQGTNLQTRRVSIPQKINQIIDGQPTIDDVFNDQEPF